MSPLVFIPALGIVAALLWWLSTQPPLGAPLLIRIREGKPGTTRGGMSSHALADLEEILRDHQVSRGFVAKNGDGRVVFSRSIPESCRQQLRNVLTNS